MNATWLRALVRRLPVRGRPIFLTSLFGLAAGLSAVAFQLGMTVVYNHSYLTLARQRPVTFLLGSLGVILVTSFIVGWLLNSYSPEASGSGIPQLKAAFWKDFGYVPFRVVWVKFLGGVLSIGGGCSLGREGPSVQLAGGLASNVAGLLGEPKQNRRPGAAAGAAAGLAAAFNTPLAAVTFVLEEIIGDLNSRLLGSILLAAVIGAFVVHAIIGRQPAFLITGVESPGWIVYALIPFVAGLAAVIGSVFQRLTMRLRLSRKEFRHIAPWARPALGGLITWALGSAVFLSTGHLGVFGLGYDDLSTALAGNLGWKIAAVLLGTKLIATICCYGLGGCGGIFSPALFFGGMVGLCLPELAGLAWPVSAPDRVALMVVGMSACLGAVVRAPVTGILIVFEMTHEFSLVPALMLGALISQAISRKLCRYSFYEEILVQDGHKLEHVIPPRDLRSWHELPVGAIANFRPVIFDTQGSVELRKLLQSHPYDRFPVVQQDRLIGILTRKEAEAALATGQPPKPERAVTCLSDETVGNLQRKLIQSNSLVALLTDETGTRVHGLVTVHDLLRAQANFAQGGDASSG